MINLRTYFSKELAKEKSSARSGAGKDDIYKSKWPHYTSMTFLRDIIVPRKTKSTLVSLDISYHFILPRNMPFVIKISAKTISNFFCVFGIRIRALLI